MSFLVATGADAGYFPLIQELVTSIGDAMGGAAVSIGVLDGGLLPEQIDWLEARGVSVVRPPLPDSTQAAVRKRPALAVNLGKLWLDVCFPGYQTLIWLDADAWVQDGAAIAEMRRDLTATMPALGTDGITYQVNLRYSAMQRMIRAAVAVG
jgi:hypothetical protein